MNEDVKNTKGSSGQNPKWRVLVFPGATEIAMELRQSLAWCKEVMLFSAGSPVSNHAPFAFARHFLLPAVSQPPLIWNHESITQYQRNMTIWLF